VLPGGSYRPRTSSASTTATTASSAAVSTVASSALTTGGGSRSGAGDLGRAPSASIIADGSEAATASRRASDAAFSLQGNE
jgi:hypothetical protein